MTGEGRRDGGRRDRRRAETRRRILEATVDLHTSIGVARTTISAIAERAGVQRHTVYAHFPEEAQLLRACTALWEERNPFPDVRRWARIADPRRRLEVALDELYRYYERSGDDLAAVFAGGEGVPGMREFFARRAEQGAALARVIARGRGARGRRRARLLAVLEHAVDLDTWRALGVRRGLRRGEVVALMAALADVACAPAASGSRRRATAPPAG